MQFSPGSVFFGDATFFQAPTVTGANDGTSLNGTIVQLGGPDATPTAADLLDDRNIPFNGFFLKFSQIGQAAGKHLILKYDPAAAGLFEPYIEFQGSTGVNFSTLRIDSTGAIYFGQNNGVGITGRQNFGIGPNVFRGADAGIRDSIGIGAQALFGASSGGVGLIEKIVAIGSDCCDMGVGFTLGSQSIFIGSDCNDAAANNVGAGEIWIGPFINNGSTVLAGNTGDFCILIGHGIGTGGGATNLTIIGHALTSLLSNLVLLGRFDQNVVVGAALLGETDDGNKLQVRGNTGTEGFAPAIRTTTVLAETFGAKDYTILADTTAGNMTVTIDPTIIKNRIGNLMKISADVNTVTLSAASGNIFSPGTVAATLPFNVQGENLQFQSDGVNIYIL